MASGTTHDNVGYALTPVVGAIAYGTADSYLSALNWASNTLGLAQSDVSSGAIAALTAAAYFAGIQWFSPDLDVTSKPYYRWGMFKLLWAPYQAIHKHRGVSHWPIIGTAGRLAYAIAPIALLMMLSGNYSLMQVLSVLLSHPIEVFAVFVGLELSALTHLFLDGMLWPKLR